MSMARWFTGSFFMCCLPALHAAGPHEIVTFGGGRRSPFLQWSARFLAEAQTFRADQRRIPAHPRVSARGGL